MENEKTLAVFQGKNVRRTWHKNEWWFSVIDVVEVLTDSDKPRDYWYRMKVREQELGIELSTNCRQLKLTSADGKNYSTDCANTEGIFRVIQSIPSPKAEPFKLWLAKVGYERVKEIEDPERLQRRMREIYHQKGYSNQWIENRVRGVAIRDELVDEWNERNVQGKEYALLTDEISKAVFGMTTNEYRTFKGLDKGNLRDHMNDWELIFTLFSEKAATDIARARDAEKFEQNRNAAKRGGEIAYKARKELEGEIGKTIFSKTARGKRK